MDHLSIHSPRIKSQEDFFLLLNGGTSPASIVIKKDEYMPSNGHFFACTQWSTNKVCREYRGLDAPGHKDRLYHYSSYILRYIWDRFERGERRGLLLGWLMRGSWNLYLFDEVYSLGLWNVFSTVPAAWPALEDWVFWIIMLERRVRLHKEKNNNTLAPHHHLHGCGIVSTNFAQSSCKSSIRISSGHQL